MWSLRPLCEGLECGASSVEEGVEQSAGVPSGLYLVVMEWMAAITGDRVGYFGIFLRGENFGELSSVWQKRKLKFKCFSFKLTGTMRCPVQ